MPCPHGVTLTGNQEAILATKTGPATYSGSKSAPEVRTGFQTSSPWRCLRAPRGRGVSNKEAHGVASAGRSHLSNSASAQSSPLSQASSHNLEGIQGTAFTQRKPRWLLPVLDSPLPRVPTIYRVQYWSVQRKDP